ncbi:MAG: SurA N-terminal domain-containing protein [Armatimonadota bacterium]
MNLRISLGRAAAMVVGSGLLTAAIAGCGGDKAYFTVNGQVVTRDEFIHKMERQQIPLPNGVAVGTEPYILDQLVSNRIMLEEAAKAGVMPTEEDVERIYTAQKDLYENRTPGKKYDEFLASQGVLPDEIKADLRGQLAEANVYAKLMGTSEDTFKAEYEKVKDKIGLPARTQMRLILVPPKSPLFDKAKAAVAEAGGDAAKFEQAAAQLNSDELRAAKGLQVVPNAAVPPTLQAKLLQAAEGSVVGPLSWPIGPRETLEGWVRIEKKLPAFNLPPEQAIAIVRIGVIQQKALLPENQKFRAEIMKRKLDVKFESSDPAANAVWKGIRDQAVEAGLGQAPSAPPAGTPGN